VSQLPEPGRLSETPAEADLDAVRDLAMALEDDDPDRLGSYELLGRLGEGGMGTVYLARSGDGRRVALKVIRPELAADNDFIRRFHREVGAARQVAGFCTARVLDAGLDPPQPYLVTEYVEGVRLDRAVERNGPLRDSNLDGFAVGVAAALTAIHAAGVVHRDLKPSNVLLSYFGPRVIDFGIARALHSPSDVTRASVVMGTPGWMAPEQLTGKPPGQPSDIFVWGTLVAFAATGRSPFGTGPATEVAYRIVNGEPDLKGFDGPLRRTVEKAMAKDAERRPTAKKLLMELLGEQLDDPVPPSETSDAVTTVLNRTWDVPVALAAAAEPTTEERAPRFPAPAPAPAPRGGPLTPPLRQPAPAARQAPPAPRPQPQRPQPRPSQWDGREPWRREGLPPAHGNGHRPAAPPQRQPQPQVRPQPQLGPNGPLAHRNEANGLHSGPGPGFTPPAAQPRSWAPPAQQWNNQRQLGPPPQPQVPIRPGGGGRTRRGAARALAWVSTIGVLLSLLGVGLDRRFGQFGLRMCMLTAALTLAFWLLPKGRNRFMAVFARGIGLIGSGLVLATLLALAQEQAMRSFGTRMVGAFAVTLLAYWMYPKRQY
jgi:serine/threonine protein kinase